MKFFDMRTKAYRHPNRVQEVNAALKKLGVAERLFRGRTNYYYFGCGNAPLWPQSSVFVYRAIDMSVEEWLREYDRLRSAR